MAFYKGQKFNGVTQFEGDDLVMEMKKHFESDCCVRIFKNPINAEKIDVKDYKMWRERLANSISKKFDRKVVGCSHRADEQHIAIFGTCPAWLECTREFRQDCLYNMQTDWLMMNHGCNAWVMYRTKRKGKTIVICFGKEFGWRYIESKKRHKK